MIPAPRELRAGCSFLVRECQLIKENKQANTSDYVIKFGGNVTVSGQFNLTWILSKFNFQRAGNTLDMFHVYISHMRIGVWTPRNMRQLKRGGWGRKLRGYVINMVLFSSSTSSGEDWRNHFILRQFYYGECKIRLHF